MVPQTDILTDVKQENAFHCNSFCGIKNWSDLKSGIWESKLTCLDRLMISFTFDYRCIHLFVWMSKHNMLNISKLYNMLKFKQKGNFFFFSFRDSSKYSQVTHHIMFLCLPSPNCLFRDPLWNLVHEFWSSLWGEIVTVLLLCSYFLSY